MITISVADIATDIRAPNITGSITGNKDWARNPPVGGTTYQVYGALSLNTKLSGIAGTYENGEAMYGVSFNANASNAIFGTATTVQTSSYQVLMIIKT